MCVTDRLCVCVRVCVRACVCVCVCDCDVLSRGIRQYDTVKVKVKAGQAGGTVQQRISGRPARMNSTVSQNACTEGDARFSGTTPGKSGMSK
jgi:hypothetical protein